MRTNIEIDDGLMRQAIALSGKFTKKAVVEEALRLAVQLDRQAQAIRQLWGIGWEGDLEEMRASRFPDWDLQTGGDTRSEPPVRQTSVA
jgi:Arc/MetJ family transcription regulator